MSAGLPQHWVQTAEDSAQANRTLTLPQVGSKFLFNPEVNEPSFHWSACCLFQHDTMTLLQMMPLLAPFVKSSWKVHLWLVIYARHYYRFLWSAELAWAQLAPYGTRVEDMEEKTYFHRQSVTRLLHMKGNANKVHADGVHKQKTCFSEYLGQRSAWWQVTDLEIIPSFSYHNHHSVNSTTLLEILYNAKAA